MEHVCLGNIGAVWEIEHISKLLGTTFDWLACKIQISQLLYTKYKNGNHFENNGNHIGF